VILSFPPIATTRNVVTFVASNTDTCPSSETVNFVAGERLLREITIVFEPFVPVMSTCDPFSETLSIRRDSRVSISSFMSRAKLARGERGAQGFIAQPRARG